MGTILIVLLLQLWPETPTYQDCKAFYNETLRDLDINGKVLQKRRDGEVLALVVLNKNQKKATVRLLSNPVTEDLFKFVASGDIVIKVQNTLTIRIGHFNSENINVRVFDALCD